MTPDAVVVGAGPNGLAAAIVLAEAGRSVLVVEANDRIGGGVRSAEVTLPGFVHDICSAIHPTALASPFFRKLALDLEWVESRVPLAHPLEDGSAAILHRSVRVTRESLGEPDGRAWERLFYPFVRSELRFFDGLLRPVRIPRDPLLMARFGLRALRSSASLIQRFRGAKARALFTGCAAHSILPLETMGTASFGIVLVVAAHTLGWPCVRGGSQLLADALAKRLRELGGEIRTGERVERIEQLPASRAILFDLTPRQILSIAGDHLPKRYARRLSRYEYGPGVFKIDWALDGPIPWKSPECRDAATVHVGGSAEEIMSVEADVWKGKHPERPFVLVAQQSLFDRTRAPEGKEVGWAYCHVPHGSTADMTQAIEAQIERFAPGFRDRILARHTMNSASLERHNANNIGGDIGGGANGLMQFIFRPLVKLDPYATPNPHLFICSSSTPPGGGVHGMCGYWAAKSALRNAFGTRIVTRAR